MVQTPPLASLWSRFWAMIIDGFIILALGCLTWFIHFQVPFFGPVALSFLYYPFFYASAMHATPGKKALGIQVVSASDGRGLTLPMAFLRHLVALGSSCALFLGHFAAFFTQKRQAVHDLVADSVVINGANESINAWNAWSDTVRGTFDKAGIKTTGSSSPDRITEIERLHELRLKGAITEEEFQRMKQETLAGE